MDCILNGMGASRPASTAQAHFICTDVYDRQLLSTEDVKHIPCRSEHQKDPSRPICSLQPKRHPSPRPQIQNPRCTSHPRASSQFIQLPQRLRRHRTRQTPTPLRNRRHRLLDSLRRTPIIPMHIIPYPCINLIDVVGEVHRSGHDEEGEQRQYDNIWNRVSCGCKEGEEEKQRTEDNSFGG